MTQTCYFNKIGFSGKMGSGKTTVALLAAARLESATGNPWRIRAFADALKKLVCATYDVPLSLAYTDIGKKTVPAQAEVTIKTEDLPFPLSSIELAYINSHIRFDMWPYKNTLGQLLQYVGQWFRDIRPDYWVLAFEMSLEPDECIVVEDVRYPNEVEWLHNNFGIVCRVYGPESSRDDSRDEKHQSEIALDSCTNWDFTIDNTIRGVDMNQLHSQLAGKLSKYLQ